MNTTDATTAPDVLIVGAGPVGAFLACLLGGAGVRVTAVEQRAEPPKRSMAIGLTPPSLCRLHAAELAGTLVAAGCPVRRATVHDARGLMGAVDFSILPPPFPFILSLPQRDLVRILRERMRNLPSVCFEQGAEWLGCEQHADAVTSRIRSLQGGAEWTVRSRFLAICDGRRGGGASKLGVARPIRPYPVSFWMSDFNDRSGWGPDARLYFTPRGSLESFPLPGDRRRWVVMTDGDDLDPEAEEERLIRRVRDLAGIALSPTDRLEGGGFRPERGRMRRFVVNRAILCGDAAHVMSPIGGQGMNTGLADAWHLAATLEVILHGTAEATGPALRRFERCRMRAYRIAANRAARGMWLGTRSGVVFSALRSTLARRVFFRPPVQSRLAPRFAMWTIPAGRDPLLPDLAAGSRRKPRQRETP